jgi:hypothetical protein
MQEFDLSEADIGTVEGMKLVFEESSDFFGRITIYDFKIDGILP